MTWLARLKKTAEGPNPYPAKPTKPPFAGFAGTPAALSQNSGATAQAANDPAHAQDFDGEAFEERAAIMEHDGGLSRTEAEKLALSTDGEAGNPDRHSWPHSKAMNTAEIDTFTARVRQIIRHGLDGTKAEGLADALVVRDRDADDRRLCLECRHLKAGGSAWSCAQWRGAGLAGAGVPADVVMLLQRCNGFKEATR